jgi:aryl-alcohol dehydrogenase-like predicted oxidoreductase
MEMAPDRQGLSAAHIARSAEDSLRRLQTDYIDLYFSHRDDASVPMEETLGAYQKLIAQGKVRAIGASNFTAARLADALAVSRKSGLPRYEALQPLCACRLRIRPGAVVPAAANWRRKLFRARLRVSHREIPRARGRCKECARKGDRRNIPQRTRLQDSCGVG